MLVVPEGAQEYFNEVYDWAKKNQLTNQLDKALLRMHLYGCNWDTPDSVRITIYSDFAPQSFSVTIEKKDASGEYRHWMNGGLIFYEPKGEWSMHT